VGLVEKEDRRERGIIRKGMRERDEKHSVKK